MERADFNALPGHERGLQHQRLATHDTQFRDLRALLHGGDQRSLVDDLRHQPLTRTAGEQHLDGSIRNQFDSAARPTIDARCADLGIHLEQGTRFKTAQPP